MTLDLAAIRRGLDQHGTAGVPLGDMYALLAIAEARADTGELARLRDVVATYVIAYPWPAGSGAEAHRQEAIAALDAAFPDTEVRMGEVERRPGVDLTGYDPSPDTGELARPERDAEIERLAPFFAHYENARTAVDRADYDGEKREAIRFFARAHRELVAALGADTGELARLRTDEAQRWLRENWTAPLNGDAFLRWLNANELARKHVAALARATLTVQQLTRRYEAREIPNSVGPMWEVVEVGDTSGEAYCLTSEEPARHIAAALNADTGELARAVTCYCPHPFTPERHRVICEARADTGELARPEEKARYNESWGLAPGACNCHHGSARMCPIHTQADYDAADNEPLDHEHYWTDAPDDEEGWHCTVCGVTKYRASPDTGELARPDPMLGTPADGRHPDHGDCGQKPCPHIPARADTGELARLRERVAEAIYDAMRESDPEGRAKPWVPGGNSLKQAEARRRADRALIVQHTEEEAR